MSLLVTYLILAVVGSGAVYLTGLAVEKVWPAASLPVFLLLWFAMLWFIWLLAVKLTSPKGEPAA